MMRFDQVFRKIAGEGPKDSKAEAVKADLIEKWPHAIVEISKDGWTVTARSLIENGVAHCMRCGASMKHVQQDDGDWTYICPKDGADQPIAELRNAEAD